MDLVNFPCPGSPMVDHMEWDWACESGMCGGDNDIQLDGSTPLTRIKGGMKSFNCYGIYDQSVKLDDVVRGSGVEWYFVPLNCEMWECNDVNEKGRYALKLRQTPCYSTSGMSVEISRVSQEFNIHYITKYEPGAADTSVDAMSNDEALDFFMAKQNKPEYVIEEVLTSYKMQQEAAELNAAPPVGEPALLKMMAPVYFHCTDLKDGTPSVQRRWVRAVWYGYETCIADSNWDFSDLWCDTDWAIDLAHEAWWDICNNQMIPYIRDLELDAEEAKAVFEERDIIHGDVRISREEIIEDLFNLVAEGLDVSNPSFQDDAMQCFTEGAEQLLDHMCNIVAEGGDLADHTDRDLYHAAEIEAWDCYNAFININEDVEDLRERLYSVGAGADLHQGNVAYWNGDLVCIDFGACSST